MFWGRGGSFLKQASVLRYSNLGTRWVEGLYNGSSWGLDICLRGIACEEGGGVTFMDTQMVDCVLGTFSLKLIESADALCLWHLC